MKSLNFLKFAAEGGGKERIREKREDGGRQTDVKLASLLFVSVAFLISESRLKESNQLAMHHRYVSSGAVSLDQ